MATAVLISGGLDSAVLLAEESVRADQASVQPIYVSVGLAWERAEQSMLGALLHVAPLSRAQPLAVLTLDMSDVYPNAHWAMAGHPPGYHTPDEDVYLPGRNITLLAKAGIYCAAAGIDRLVFGTLAHNPFPDATNLFRSTMAEALSLGLAHRLTIEAPYSVVSKADVIRRGATLGVPLQLTLSCMRPQERVLDVLKVPEVLKVQEAPEPLEPLERLEPLEPFLHCGLCSKCRERHDAFLEARMVDPTRYADRRYIK